MSAGFGFSYPAGVTGNESAISGNDTIRKNVTCGEDEVQVVPSWAVKDEMLALQAEVAKILDMKTSEAMAGVDALRQSITNRLDRVYELEDVGSWDCPFTGTVDVEVLSKDQGSWDCPDCGTVHDKEDISADPEEWDR